MRHSLFLLILVTISTSCIDFVPRIINDSDEESTAGTWSLGGGESMIGGEIGSGAGTESSVAGTEGAGEMVNTAGETSAMDMSDLGGDNPLPVDAGPVDMSECGNGIVEEDEECDENGSTPTCSDTCQIISCGNGRVDQGEACDDGNDIETDLCIDQCQSSFPEISADDNLMGWEITFSDQSLNPPNLVQHCQGDFRPVANLSELYKPREGVQSYNPVADPSEIWLNLSDQIVTDKPIRIDADFFVSDGFNRYAIMNFTDSDYDCNASITGAAIKHYDQKHSMPAVLVSAKIEPDGESIIWDRTGIADSWVTMTMIYIPRSGRVRFYYNGNNLGQTLYSPSRRPTYLRIRTGYNRENAVISPISVSNLRIFQNLR